MNTKKMETRWIWEILGIKDPHLSALRPSSVCYPSSWSLIINLIISGNLPALTVRSPSLHSMAIDLTAARLTCQKLPDLHLGPSRTTSDSTHRLEFKSTLFHWTSFEKEVRREFLSAPWTGQVLAYSPSPQHESEAHIYNEQLYCGDEHSVVARFGQNVEHVMTAVHASIGIGLIFGDFKASVGTDMDGKVPDIVLMNVKGQIRALGEVKTPWRHKITDSMQRQSHFRHYLGESLVYALFRRYLLIPLFLRSNI
jgi:hypothetical protein